LIYLTKITQDYTSYLTVFCLTFQAFVQLLWNDRSYSTWG